MFILIKNVNIITPYEVLNGYGVLVRNGKISDIDLEENFNHEDYDVIDGEGNYLSPGFIDIHNHGNSGFDIMDSSKEALDGIGKYHIANGVTSYLGTIVTSSYEDIIRAMRNIIDYENKDNLAHIIGIHLEGPFFNISKKGAQPEKHIKSPDFNQMKLILDIAGEKMKMVSLAPELEGALDIIQYLKEKDIVIAMAHTEASYEETKRAINHGATIATHLYNGMRGFNHREPGILGAVLNDDRVYCEIIYDRVHLHDAAVNIALKMKGFDRIVLVSDAMRAAGLPDGEYELGNQRVDVMDGAARLKTGSLAGSTLNLRTAIYNMVNYLEIPIYEVVKMASLNAAKSINMDRYIGSIEVGKKADMVLFDRDISIKKTILNGRLIK